jgi:hypothetical protein
MYRWCRLELWRGSGKELTNLMLSKAVYLFVETVGMNTLQTIIIAKGG